MFSRFFIDRPIFAAVLSIVMVIAGGVSAFVLPVAQDPDIAPPPQIELAPRQLQAPEQLELMPTPPQSAAKRGR